MSLQELSLQEKECLFRDICYDLEFYCCDATPMIKTFNNDKFNSFYERLRFIRNELSVIFDYE